MPKQLSLAFLQNRELKEDQGKESPKVREIANLLPQKALQAQIDIKSKNWQHTQMSFMPPSKLTQGQESPKSSRDLKNASQPLRFMPNHLEVGSMRNKTPLVDTLRSPAAAQGGPQGMSADRMEALKQMPKGQIKNKFPQKNLEGQVKSISFYRNEEEGLDLSVGGSSKQSREMRVAGQTVFSRRGQSLQQTIYSAREANSNERNEQKRYETIVNKSRA